MWIYLYLQSLEFDVAIGLYVELLLFLSPHSIFSYSFPPLLPVGYHAA